jgi:hypothetical protein
MSLKAVTANRLREGDVVYLTDRGHWSLHLNESRISGDKAEQEAMLAQAMADVEARKIIGPYLMDIVEVDGILQPLSTRETIRAAGPTVRADFRGPKQNPASQSPRAA